MRQSRTVGSPDLGDRGRWQPGPACAEVIAVAQPTSAMPPSGGERAAHAPRHPHSAKGRDIPSPRSVISIRSDAYENAAEPYSGRVARGLTDSMAWRSLFLLGSCSGSCRGERRSSIRR